MKRLSLFIALALSLGIFSGCNKDEEEVKPTPELNAEISLRNATEEDESDLEVRVKALILDVKGTDIVSGYAGLFESDKVSEAEYENAVVAFPIDQDGINAINSEAGWTKRYDGQRCLPPEEDGRPDHFHFVAVVKLTNKAGVTKVITDTADPILELPPK